MEAIAITRIVYQEYQREQKHCFWWLVLTKCIAYSKLCYSMSCLRIWELLLISIVSYRKHFFILIAILFSGTSATFLSITGAGLNLVTILALLDYYPVREHVTTPFVISLACSDLLFSTVILPLMAIRFFAQ